MLKCLCVPAVITYNTDVKRIWVSNFTSDLGEFSSISVTFNVKAPYRDTEFKGPEKISQSALSVD